MLNLATDAWLPIRRKDGQHLLIEPWMITADLVTNPVVAIDAPRAPWNGALTEFLISLYQTVLFPEDARIWRERWNDPPTPEYLKKEISKVATLFTLTGERPFMQDRSLEADTERHEVYRKPVQKLLVDGVSEQQEKNHSDLFLKTGAIGALCPSCAAAALWDLQAHSPQGSAGYYTSLRGGGPSSTIILADTLWKTVWANVVEQSFFDMKGRPDPATFLPWLDHRQRTVKRADENPLHVMWGMPRRVFLEFKEDPSGTCDICSAAAPSAVRGFLSYRGGLKYAEADWRHPLSPYLRTKEETWCVRGTESDIVGYRHWMGLLVDTPAGDGVPSFVVRLWLERDVPKEPFLRLWGYGYKTDQAAINVWCEGKMPIVTVANGLGKEYDATVRTLVVLSQRAAEKLSNAVHGALKMSNAEAPGRSREAVVAFWRRTEPRFFQEIGRAADQPSKAAFEEIADGWMKLVQQEAMKLYDEILPAERVEPSWGARYGHRLRRELSGRDPVTLKTRKYGDWRLTDA